MLILLCEDYESNELLSTDISEAISTVLPQVGHEVQNRFTSQHLVAHIGTEHDRSLVLQDSGGISRPDGQPGIRYE